MTHSLAANGLLAISIWLPVIGWLLLAVPLLLMPLLCFSLRDFSRSTLQEVCEQRGNLARFGRILTEYERVLLICELLLIVLMVCVCLVFVSSPAFDLLRIPEKSDFSTTVLWIARMS